MRPQIISILKLNASYQAFLITSLLFGVVILSLASIKLKAEQKKEIENFDIAIIEDEPVAIEEIEQEIIPVETHEAYNEAEEFIKELEQQRASSVEEFEKELDKLDAAIENSLNNRNTEPANVSEIETKDVTTGDNKENYKGNNRNSTNSFHLVNRDKVNLRNPVYLCDAFGKVVVMIDVNDKGFVVKATISNSLSTTKNQCLIEVALKYAKRSSFTEDLSKPLQKGTITYNFPGQK